MICSVQSRDPKKYNTASINLDIPWKCRYIKWWVSAINTQSNILLSTDQDYIKYQVDDEVITFEFENKFTYSLNSLQKFLNTDTPMNFEINNERTFTMTPGVKGDVDIIGISHRAALLTGLYNAKLPIRVYYGEKYVIQDLPVIQHNKFYLVSLQGNPMYSSVGEYEYTPSVIGNIDTIALDGRPFIHNFDLESKPIKIKTYTDSLKYLEMTLVDFMYQPVELKNPLFITVKIQPAKDADINEVITK